MEKSIFGPEDAVRDTEYAPEIKRSRSIAEDMSLATSSRPGIPFSLQTMTCPPI